MTNALYTIRENKRKGPPMAPLGENSYTAPYIKQRITPSQARPSVGLDQTVASLQVCFYSPYSSHRQTTQGEIYLKWPSLKRNICRSRQLELKSTVAQFCPLVAGRHTWTKQMGVFYAVYFGRFQGGVAWGLYQRKLWLSHCRRLGACGQ